MFPLVLYAALVIFGTLYPFQFAWHPAWDQADPRSRIAWLPAWLPLTRHCPDCGFLCRGDAALNLVLLFPIGVLIPLLPGAGPSISRRVLRAGLVGFALSLAIEIAQHFLPARFSSAGDLVLNTLGAALGGLLAAGAVELWTQFGPKSTTVCGGAAPSAPVQDRRGQA